MHFENHFFICWYVSENIRPCCFECNVMKLDMLFDDFINHKSYENITNPHHRLKEMCKELKRVLEFDILEFRNNNLNRITKNALLVHTLSNKGFDILNNFHKTTLL